MNQDWKPVVFKKVVKSKTDPSKNKIKNVCYHTEFNEILIHLVLVHIQFVLVLFSTPHRSILQYSIYSHCPVFSAHYLV